MIRILIKDKKIEEIKSFILSGEKLFTDVKTVLEKHWKDFKEILDKKNLIIVRYKNSFIYKNRSTEIKDIKVPHGEVVDMTAAGDSFNGSFLALMHNDNNIPIEEKILKAHLVTSEVIKKELELKFILKDKQEKIKKLDLGVS